MAESICSWTALEDAAAARTTTTRCTCWEA